MIDIYDRLRELRTELAELARQLVANAIQFTQFTRSTSSGEHDKVAGYRTEGVGEQPYDYEVRRLQHFGFRSCPPSDVWAVRVAATGGATNNVTVAEDSTRYGPSDLGDGEVAVYCKTQGVLVRLSTDGSVKITDKSGAELQLDGKANASLNGQSVSLAGGGPSVARVGDAVEVTIPSGTVIIPQPSGPPIANPSPIAVSGKVTAGSSRVTSG
jgi:phage gp45-like